MVNGHVATGPDGVDYIYPAPCQDDWEAWILLHDHPDMPKWSPPPYAHNYEDWKVSRGLSDTKSS